MISAIAGLPPLATRLTEQTPAAHEAMEGASVRPNAAVIVLGFLAAGAVLGAVFGAIGSRIRRGPAAPDWLARYAVVCVIAVLPLLAVGGLVTSTNAGMAVPDWPNTYGTNMFLYPLGPRMQTGGVEDPHKVYLEHSHRLFGTLVGMATLVLVIWAVRSRIGGGLKALAVSVFALVVLQGVLGGTRVLRGSSDVTKDERWWAVMHGVLGQLVFALLVALSAKLWLRNTGGGPEITSPLARRCRFFATAAMHATVLQLVFGAMYRHLRSPHVLWSHVGFSLIVALAGVMAGATAVALARDPAGIAHPAGRAVRRLGAWTAGLVALQFALGWVTFLSGGVAHEPENAWQAIVRTAHQTNGAFFLAVAVSLFVIIRRVAPKARGHVLPAGAPQAA
ncbi:MAG TPA: COX15/CtaA family protein [Acetobacteraceae bacterium]|nr:COX15/CtaA family protein [Acetobacteraceae bacterium]